MQRNDERNDRMLDSNDLGAAPGRAASSSDPTIEGNDRPRRTADLAHRDDNPGDEIGEAVGGISGVLTGAALGSLGGPIGTIIGGIAGAVTGWWAGKAISEAASHVTHEDEEFYRTHYERSPHRLADRSYDEVRPAYQLGHLAGRNPEYQGRSFEDVETDLQRGWSSEVSARHGDWQQVRHYARDAYERGRSGFGTGAVAGSATSSTSSASGLGAAGSTPGGTLSGASSGAARAAGGAAGAVAGAAGYAADRVDDLKDRIDANPASRPGPDATDRPGYGGGAARTGDTLDRAATNVDNTWERTKAGASNLADRAADKVDDLKDRVDGNPASRPGPDATDRAGYGSGTGSSYGTSANYSTTGGGMAADSVDRPGLGDDARRAGNRVENAAERVGDKVENAWERTKEGARNLADKVGEKVDNTKDRVDGNPASRPGPDATDRKQY
jgi:hypothetical protein